MRLLLDTDVLIDYFVRREPYFKDWVELRTMQELGDAELWVSAKSFSDTFSVARNAIEEPQLEQAFLESLGFLEVCSLASTDIELAAEASWSDFDGCLIDLAAQKVKADYIITRNGARFSKSRVSSLNMKEFLDQYGQHKELELEAPSL